MKRLFIVVLIGMGLAGGFCLPVAATKADITQIILVLWHGLGWDDVEGLQFDSPAALGFLNTRAAGGESLTAAYLTLGAGARAMGSAGAAAFYQDEAGGKELYRRHTGLEPSQIVQPRIAQIKAAQTANYRIEPGALGTALLEAAVPLRVLGNSDALDAFSWAALVGMDNQGRVWEGSVGEEFTLLAADYPYGLRTDYAHLLAEVRQAEEMLVIVDLGDPFRFDQYQKHFTPDQRQTIERLIFSEARDLLASIVEDAAADNVVWLVSPYPSQSKASRGYWLTPTLCWGLGEGILISATTRWPGLIANIDLAPSILGLLQIDHSQPLIGRPATIQARSRNESLAWLETMGDKIESLSRYRGQVLRALVIGQILIYSAVLIALIASTSLPKWVRDLLQGALLLLMAVPLALLLWDWSYLAIAILFLAIAFLKCKDVPTILLVGLITFSTALAITCDVFFDSWLIRYSFLGYDPIGGARFYGLGNEFMGVLIGSSIMGWASLVAYTKFSLGWRNSLGILVFAGLTIVVGAPSLGTNVGGAISCVLGFGSTWMCLAEKRIRFRTVVILTMLTFLVLAALMLVDSGNSAGEQSHIGQTVEVVRRDGPSAIFQIITRKLAMNIRLLRYSMWSNALLVALVGIGASFIWPSKYIAWLKENHPLVAKGIVGVVIGSSAAFAFNDSGVVAAATCLSFASSTLLLLALELKHDFVAPQSDIENDGHRN